MIDDNNNNYYSIKVNIITILLLKLLLLSVYPFCVKYSKNTPKFSIPNTNLGAKTKGKAAFHHHAETQRERKEPLETKSYLLHAHIYIQSVICASALVVCASSSLKLIKSSIF